jgi:hypothetical protein
LPLITLYNGLLYTVRVVDFDTIKRTSRLIASLKVITNALLPMITNCWLFNTGYGGLGGVDGVDSVCAGEVLPASSLLRISVWWSYLF